jgi:hypothetical protein
MVHKHSIEAEQRRLARRLALTSAFQDRILQESVNTLTSDDLKTLLGKEFEFVLPTFTDVTRGEVLLDSRGRGSCQPHLCCYKNPTAKKPDCETCPDRYGCVAFVRSVPS